MSMPSLKNDTSPDKTRSLNGTDASVWHKSAPASVRKAFSAGELSDGWSAWREHLSARRQPKPVTSLLPDGDGGLSWAVPDSLDGHGRPDWLERSAQASRPDPAIEKDMLEWLAESAGTAASAAYGFDAVACCRGLPQLAGVLSPEAWWALLDHLATDADEAGTAGVIEDPLVRQLLAGELALTMAYLFPEINACRKLKSSARGALSAGLVDLLDGEGLPEAGNLHLFRPLLACWTRCRAIGGQIPGRSFSKAALEQYEWMVRQALRLTRHDGTQVFSHGPSGVYDGRLFQAALLFGGDQDDEQIAGLVLPRKKGRSKPGDESRLPEPAYHSPWASAAVLRPAWSRTSERLTVLYHESPLQIELACGKDVLWSGAWQLDVRLDGKLLEPGSDWGDLCWISDDDADYLELELELGEVRVQRQILLAREDRFLFLADVVLGEQPGKIDYRGCLPLLPGVEFRAADESREGILAGVKRRAAVLPLALPEWQADERIGELARTAAGLELRQTCEGRRLYAPLFFDLDRNRHRKRLTWRQLTVAESLEVQPPEVAAGYRVAIGRQQWLVYRSLAEKANRTLLGHNLSSEMLVARFDESGEVEPLVEIE